MSPPAPVPGPASGYQGRTAVLLTACGATFLAVLDSTATNLAVAGLHRDFPSAAVADLSWVVTAYVVMFAALLVTAGRLADLLGRRRLFIAGTVLFTMASLLAATAPHLAMLVTARALQGAGAAAMVPAALAILLVDLPAQRRASAIGVWSAATALAAAVGPSVGGVLVDWLGWRAVFLVNLPFGAALLVAAWYALPASRRGEPGRVPDLIGTVLLVAGIGALTLGLTKGQVWQWDHPRTVACVAGGLAAVVYAVFRSTRVAVPAVETALWADRTFRTANAVSLLFGLAQYPWILVGVLYLTDVWRYDTALAGLANTPGALVSSVVALGLGRVTGRHGPRPVTTLGLLAVAACGLWVGLSLTTEPAFLALWLPANFLCGAGMGATSVGTSSAAALSAPPSRFAGASAMNTMARQLGGALGVASLAVLLPAGGVYGASAYSKVYLFCAVVLALATVVAAVGLRFGALPASTSPSPVDVVAVGPHKDASAGRVNTI